MVSSKEERSGAGQYQRADLEQEKFVSLVLALRRGTVMFLEGFLTHMWKLDSRDFGKSSNIYLQVMRCVRRTRGASLGWYWIHWKARTSVYWWIRTLTDYDS